MTATDEGLLDAGAACAPNIAPAGRRKRQRDGVRWAAVAFVLAVGGAVERWSWAVRALVFIPAALSAIGFLQARRHTCVLRAAQGTVEREDRSTTPAPAAEVTASRRMSRRIVRDTILIGLLAGALSVATTLVR